MLRILYLFFEILLGSEQLQIKTVNVDLMNIVYFLLLTATLLSIIKGESMIYEHSHYKQNHCRQR